MKLASLKNGTRDGRLVVVSRDLTRYTDASFLVPTLQAALDNWARISPHLEALAESLEHGSVPTERFHEHDAVSPLPRAFQAGEAAGIYGGPRDAIIAPDAAAVVVVPGVAALVTDLPRGASDGQAGEAVALLTLLCTGESPACGPVAATVGELDGLWSGGNLTTAIHIERSGKTDDRLIAVDFAARIAEAAARQPLWAGAVIPGAAGDALDLRTGDRIRIEIRGRDGHSLFGAIERNVEAGAS